MALLDSNSNGMNVSRSFDDNFGDPFEELRSISRSHRGHRIGMFGPNCGRRGGRRLPPHDAGAVARGTVGVDAGADDGAAGSWRPSLR